MSNWFSIFLLPFVTLAIPMLAVLVDVLRMKSQQSAFSQSHGIVPGDMKHAGLDASGPRSDRDTLGRFVARS